MRTSLIALRLFVIILKEKQNYSFALVWLKDVVSFVSSSIDAPIAAEKDVVFHAHHSSTNRNVKTKSNYQLNADLFNLTFEICPSRGFIPHLNGLSRSKLYNSFTCIRVFFFVHIYMYLYHFTFEFISIIRVSERQNFCLGFHEIDYCKSSFINLHLGSLQIRSSYLLAKKQKTDWNLVLDQFEYLSPCMQIYSNQWQLFEIDTWTDSAYKIGHWIFPSKLIWKDEIQI